MDSVFAVDQRYTPRSLTSDDWLLHAEDPTLSSFLEALLADRQDRDRYTGIAHRMTKGGMVNLSGHLGVSGRHPNYTGENLEARRPVLLAHRQLPGKHAVTRFEL